MLASCIIGISTGLSIGSTVYARNLYLRDKTRLQSFLNGKHDKINNIYLTKAKIQGSHHVFSLSANNAIYNKFSIYQDQYNEVAKVDPVYTTRGVGFSVGTALEKNTNKIFHKVYKAEEIKCNDEIINFDKIHLYFDENNVIQRQITFADFNKLSNNDDIGTHVPMNSSIYEEKFIVDNTEVFCVVKNNSIEAIVHNNEQLKKYMKKYYMWHSGGYAVLVVIIVIIIAAIFIKITLDIMNVNMIMNNNH